MIKYTTIFYALLAIVATSAYVQKESLAAQTAQEKSKQICDQLKKMQPYARSEKRYLPSGELSGHISEEEKKMEAALKLFKCE